jgi:hypothetical protein
LVAPWSSPEPSPTTSAYGFTPTGVIQSSVTLKATTIPLPELQFPSTASFIMTAPSVTVSLAPLTASVALGGTPQFIGYAVGNLNNTLTWQT